MKTIKENKVLLSLSVVLLSIFLSGPRGISRDSFNSIHSAHYRSCTLPSSKCPRKIILSTVPSHCRSYLVILRLTCHHTNVGRISTRGKTRLFICRKFRDNVAAQFWYLFKCIYFGYSSVQVRLGYPKRIAGNFLMKKFNYLNQILYRM